MTKTIYIRCQHIASRGALVNDFLFAHRHTLSIESWYGDGGNGRLCRDAPLEVVHVRASRKPFFLLECRYPTEEEELEKERRKAVAAAGDDEEKDAAEEAGERVGRRVSEEELDRATAALETLGKTDPDTPPLRFRDSDVHISAALPGVTVASERKKLLARLKRAREEGGTNGGETGDDAHGAQRQRQKTEEAPPKRGGSGSAGGGTKKEKVTATSFVPRSVRRR